MSNEEPVIVVKRKAGRPKLPPAEKELRSRATYLKWQKSEKYKLYHREYARKMRASYKIVREQQKQAEIDAMEAK